MLLATSVNEKFKLTINEETKTKSKTLLLKKFNDKEKYQSISLNKISGKFVIAIPSIISRWSSIAAAILIFSTIGTTTLVSASSDSNPDENLYPVKRAVENMRLTLTFNSEKKNELRMGYSNKRIEEMTSMANKGVFEKIDYQDIDPSTIQFLDLKLGNICNLKCRICGSWSSSKWAQEQLDYLKADGTSKEDLKKSEHYRQLQMGQWPRKTEVFWDELETYLPGVKYFEFTGGEPMMI